MRSLYRDEEARKIDVKFSTFKGFLLSDLCRLFFSSISTYDSDDTLVIQSKATGKSIEVPVSKNSIKASDFRKLKLESENGIAYVILFLSAITILSTTTQFSAICMSLAGLNVARN